MEGYMKNPAEFSIKLSCLFMHINIYTGFMHQFLFSLKVLRQVKAYEIK